MIIDQIDNIKFYNSIIKNLDNALAAIKSQEESMEAGRYEFEGGFFMVQKGETKPMEEGFFEAHRKYIDIQIILRGSEEVAWSEIRDLKTEIPYNEKKDAEYLSGSFNHTMLMTEGMFYVAYPHDGHRPVRHTTNQQSYTKIVVKLPV